MKLEDRVILITGGAGFIGSYLAEKLAPKNKLIILDNLVSSTKEYITPLLDQGEVSFVYGDVADTRLLNDLLDDVDLVCHFAADPDVRNSTLNPYTNFNQNVTATLMLLEQMRLHGISELIFASSGGTVYGDSPPMPTPETAPLSPISPYGATKAACEMYLSAYAGSYNFTATALRYANVIGPRSNHGIIFDFHKKLTTNPRSLEILGNGQQRKSYIYVTDCINASIIAAESTESGYNPINIGVPEQITATEIGKQVATAMGLTEVEFSYTGGDRGWTGDVPVMEMSYQKLADLGWKPQYSISDAIHEYVQWLKDQAPRQ
jgi:UDP-glucose 4-epimerase